MSRRTLITKSIQKFIKTRTHRKFLEDSATQTINKQWRDIKPTRDINKNKSRKEAAVNF